MLRVRDHFDQQLRYDVSKSEKERRKWFIASKERQERREDLSEKAEEAFVEFATAVIVATEIERIEFQTKLDKYDTATTQALMLNVEELERVQASIHAMLEHAHVLEDGRRVFKSEDGKWAVDEFGNRLDPEIYNIDELPKTSITAESYADKLDERDRLVKQRDELHKFQDKLDGARERSNANDFTQEEKETLEEELETQMPLAAKQQMAGYEHVEPASSKSEFTAAAKVAVDTQMTKDLAAIPMPS